MAQFEGYERREAKILGVLKEYGISSIDECKEITLEKHCAEVAVTETDLAVLRDGAGDAERLQTDTDCSSCVSGSTWTRSSAPRSRSALKTLFGHTPSARLSR